MERAVTSLTRRVSASWRDTPPQPRISPPGMSCPGQRPSRSGRDGECREDAGLNIFITILTIEESLYIIVNSDVTNDQLYCLLCPALN